jgi:hypothetical protein
VLRVTAYVRKKDPQTGALAERLLAPIVNWRDKPARAEADGEASGDEPEDVDPSGPKG